MLAISSLQQVAEILYYHLDLPDSLKKCLLLSFSYKCKVIIQRVSNIIRIGYSITIIKRDCSWYTGGYSF